ncbi:MAG: rhodanese-like domain-containing protein [Luteolibacter sp.]
MSTITAKSLGEKLSRGEVSPSQIIDVRTPAEFREISVEGSELIPLDEINDAKVREKVASGPVFLLCKSGARSTKAQAKLSGSETVVVVEGGIESCCSGDFHLNRGKAAISLERQVRIAAGLMVFIGTLLGAFMNPWFLILPGFVGAGLAFAGITDTCGMGMLLAKMPWNRIS